MRVSGIFGQVLLACCMLLPAASGTCQTITWSHADGPRGGIPTSIATAPDGTIFTGMLGGGVIVSTDQGATWFTHNAGLADRYVYMLFRESGGRLFAGTRDSGLYRSDGIGVGWVRVSPSRKMPAGMVQVHDTLIAASTDDGVIRSLDRGVTWNSLGTIAAGKDVRSFVLSTSGDLLAGHAYGGVYRSSDAGRTWTVSSTGVENITVSILLPTPAGRIFALGGSSVCRSSDDGRTWQVVPGTGLSGSVYYLNALNADRLYAGTSAGNFVSTDFGDSWQAFSLQRGNASLVYILRTAGNRLLALPSGAELLESSDEGVTWTSTGSGFDGNRVYTIEKAPDGSMYAGAAAGIGSRSTDGGATWKHVFQGLTPQIVNCWTFTPSGGTLAGTNVDGVYYSSNAGASWELRNEGLGVQSIYALKRLYNGTILAGWDQGVSASTDDGLHWSPVPGNVSTFVYDIRTDPGGRVYAAVGDSGVYLSTDNGANWTPRNAGIETQSVSRILPAAYGELFIGTGSAGVFRSADNGLTWAAVNAGLDNLNITGVAENSHGVLFAATWGNGVYRSNDRGNHWIRESAGLDAPFTVSLACTDGDILLAGTQGNSIYRANATVTRIEATQMPGAFVSVAHFPNPIHGSDATETATFRFTLPRAESISLHLYDGLGREVAVIAERNFPAGTTSYSWRISDLTGGLYYYLLRTQSGATGSGVLILE